jgi:hypothetical protein
MKKTLIILILTLLYSVNGMAQHHNDSLLKMKIGIEAGALFSILKGGNVCGLNNSAAYHKDYYLKNNFGAGGNLGVFTEIYTTKKFAFRIGLDYNMLINNINYGSHYYGPGAAQGNDTAEYTLYYSLARISLAPTFYFAKSRLFFSLGINKRYSIKNLSFTDGYIHYHSQAYFDYWDSIYYPQNDGVLHNNEILSSLEFQNKFGIFLRFGGQMLKNNDHFKIEFTIYNLFNQYFIKLSPYRLSCGSINLTYMIKE